MTDAQIKHMTERFLRWKLPENFNPDGGISFQRIFNENTPYPSKAEPSGTNLFDYNQAKAMVQHLVEGLPEAAPQDLNARLVKAATALRDDMMERAEFGMDVIKGEQYRIVNAGNSAWADFVDALEASVKA